MIPVITSTKTDKSAIDLAGVEAGAKIFVPCFGSLAHTVTADQKRRGIVCASDRTVEDFLNIDILFFRSASEIRWNEEQACYQRDRHSHLLHRTRSEGHHPRNPDQ